MLLALAQSVIKAAPTLTPKPPQPSIVPDASWVAPVGQSVIGVLLATILIKIFVDSWHNFFNRPKIYIGFLNPKTNTLEKVHYLNQGGMETTSMGINLCIELKSRWPYAKESWLTRVNAATEGELKLSSRKMMSPGHYFLMKETVGINTKYQINGISAILPSPKKAEYMTVMVIIGKRSVSERLKFQPLRG